MGILKNKFFDYGLLMIGLILLNSSCSDIYVESPIISPSESSKANIPYKYWLSYENGKDYPSDVFIVAPKSKGVWSAKQNNGSAYEFMFIPTDKQGTYIVQIKIGDRYSVTYFVVNTKDEYVLYEPSMSSIYEKAKASYSLKKVQKYITYDDTDDDGKKSSYPDLIFTETACRYYKEEIITFLKGLSVQNDFTKNKTLVGTTDVDLVNRILKSKEKKGKNTQNANKKTGKNVRSNSVVNNEKKTTSFSFKMYGTSGKTVLRSFPISIGDNIKITAKGRVNFGFFAGPAGPKGFTNGLYQNYNIVRGGNHGALICRVGTNRNDWILVGNEVEFVSQKKGYLELLINDNDSGNNSGSFSGEISITR
ncbi:hypothetical protein [Aquimarina litoralis]|uniref:hypothetical protein n=1 Tax=Aquimarina litoralis TaxID=584605 RepID=UPI001C5A3237|nr:hypothetical protein [Aquimarina litoralis]MBW1296011.1 hypothetical protein [Aquimarina litoralis]